VRVESGAAGSSVPGDSVVLDLERLMWREVGEEIIVLDKRNWTYMGINGSGALLWRELVEGASSARLAERLREEYGLAEDAALRDVRAFLELLRGHGLLADPAGG
jgi:Coenzyme PQQ synthesis protein D (PqqD)